MTCQRCQDPADIVLWIDWPHSKLSVKTPVCGDCHRALHELDIEHTEVPNE